MDYMFYGIQYIIFLGDGGEKSEFSIKWEAEWWRALQTRTETGYFGRGGKRDFQAFGGSHIDYPSKEWSKKCIKGGMWGRALKKVALRDGDVTCLHWHFGPVGKNHQNNPLFHDFNKYCNQNSNIILNSQIINRPPPLPQKQYFSHFLLLNSLWLLFGGRHAEGRGSWGGAGGGEWVILVSVYEKGSLLSVEYQFLREVHLFDKYKSTYNSWCAQKIMEAMTPSLIKSSEEVLRDNLSDSDKFQALYYDILESRTMGEDQPLAQRVGPLTQSQLYLLQSQILAYKHLIRNIPVPTNLNWSGLHSNIWQTQKQKLTTKLVTYYRDKIQKEQEFKSMITGTIRPPFKDNPQENTEEIKKMLAQTQQQIDQLLLRAADFTPETRLKLSIQRRFLGIRQIYHRVLGRIVGNIKSDNKSVRLFEEQLLDRGYFRREKLQKNRNEGNRVEKLENQVKSDHERRKKIKHKQFMQHLRIHKEEFLEWHRKKQKDRKKISNQAKSNYDLKKKEKEMIQDKKDFERLEALKKQDMVTYFKLVELEKNNKIKELLNQTDKFLKELGAKVLIQKGTSQDDNDDLNDQKQPGEPVNEQTLESNFNNSNNIYYNLTHTVKEEIKKQPSILEGGQLKNYQLVGLQWLVSLYNNSLNGILADEMGLGKTIQTISLLSYLIQFKKNYGPFLIVVPLSTISNWMSQFDKWAPSIRKIVYRGNPTTRNEILKQMKSTKWNVCITTYDFILKDRLRLNKYDWKYIIIDEGHKIKNAKSKFAGVLGQQYHSNHRLLLTGTPLQNNLGELWALLNFLLPKVFNSCDDFEKWFSIAISKKTGEKESVTLTEEEQLLIINRLHQVLRPFLLRRVKKEVESQLPDKKEHVIKVQLSGWQKLIYDNISRKTALQFDNNSGKVSTTTLTNLMMQLRKCCNHPYMFLKNYDDICYHDWIFRSSGKFELIDRILPKLKEFGHRVLIFTQMTHLMDIMQIYFDYKGIKHLRLDGSTKADDRGQRTSLFNEENSQYDVFLLSTRAGGLGLNLQTADTVILFDSDWNPQMDLQAQDRAHRIGQKKEVIVLRFITNTPIEQAILKKAGFKMNLDELFIQGGLYNLNSSDVERKQKIEELLKRRNKDEENSRDEIPDDEQINRCIARNEEQLARFQQMDEERYERERKIYKNFCEQKQSGEEQDQTKAVNYRLMTEDQIPSWFLDAALPKAAEKAKEYGRGNRVRKQVNYCDDAQDDQFINANEEQEEQPEDESSLIDVPKRRRRGRNLLKETEKSKSVDPAEESDE